MTERKQVAGFKGRCFGPSGELQVPATPTIGAFTTNGRSELIIGCKFLNPDNSCNAAELKSPPCVIFDSLRPVEEEPTELRCVTPAGELVFDSQNREVTTSPLLSPGHEAVPLTATQGTLLEALMRNQGTTLGREKLINSLARGGHYYGNSRGIDVHMVRLRRQIGQMDPDSSTIIETVRSVGYRIPSPRSNRHSS